MSWLLEKGAHGPPWQDGRVDLLKKLWDDGLSATAIGIKLELPYADKGRSAVLGKVRRLGLPYRIMKKTAAIVPHKREGSMIEKLGKIRPDGIFVPIWRCSDRLAIVEAETDAILRRAREVPVKRRGFGRSKGRVHETARHQATA